MKKLLAKISGYFKYTRKEYEASINALNIFFGAVIGISLGGIGEIPTLDYVLLLIITAAAVTAILFVTYSERQYWSILMVGLVFFAMWWMNDGDDQIVKLPPKLLPTLAVWALMAISTEFTGLVPDEEKENEE